MNDNYRKILCRGRGHGIGNTRLKELNNSPCGIGSYFGINTENSLLVDADGGVNNSLRTGQFGILNHLVHSRCFCFRSLITTDTEKVRSGRFATDMFNNSKIVL